MESGTENGLYPGSVQLKAERTQDFSSRSSFMQAQPFMRWKYSSQIEELNLRLYQDLSLLQVNFTYTNSTRFGSSNLTLLEAVEQASGSYVAEIDTLISEQSVCLINGVEDPPCNVLILPLLSHSAVARPVAYRVIVEGEHMTLHVYEQAYEPFFSRLFQKILENSM